MDTPERIHHQRPTDVEVLHPDGTATTAVAGFTVRLRYDDEVPELDTWSGEFVPDADGFDVSSVAGVEGVSMRMPTSGLSGRVLVHADGTFDGLGPAPVEVPTK